MQVQRKQASVRFKVCGSCHKRRLKGAQVCGGKAALRHCSSTPCLPQHPPLPTPLREGLAGKAHQEGGSEGEQSWAPLGEESSQSGLPASC